MSQPIRQCVSCRTRDDKKNLLRIVRTVSGNIEFDPLQKKMGRGIYLCPQPLCIAHAKSCNLIRQLFDREVDQSIYLELVEHINKSQNHSLEKLLGFAARSRNLMFGMTAIAAGMKKGKIQSVIIDQLASPSTKKRIESMCHKMKIPHIAYSEKTPLEKIIGKPNCRCVGVIDSHFAQTISRKGKPAE